VRPAIYRQKPYESQPLFPIAALSSLAYRPPRGILDRVTSIARFQCHNADVSKELSSTECGSSYRTKAAEYRTVLLCVCSTIRPSHHSACAHAAGDVSIVSIIEL
jgi:hypothetical protein